MRYCSCLTDIKSIGCKWVYTIKFKSNGFVERYKAWLLALGNFQVYGINYEETFALVPKMTTIRTIMAIVASKRWSLHQMDVKNMFLHGDLKTKIYMIPPTLGMFTHTSNKVC